MLSAILLASSEAIGGAMLIIGVMTRFAPATQVSAMLVAGVLVHGSNGLTGDGSYQWALLLGAAAFALMMEGAGRFSVNRMMRNRTDAGSVSDCPRKNSTAREVQKV